MRCIILLRCRSLTSEIDPYVSMEKTRKLIDDCLFSYLQSRIDAINDRLAEPLVVSKSEETGDRRTAIKFGSHGGERGQVNAAYDIPSPTRAPPPPPSHAVPLQVHKGMPSASQPQPHPQDPSRLIFRNLENYIITCFTSLECLNASFRMLRGTRLRRAASESMTAEPFLSPKADNYVALNSSFTEMDAKTLLLGDFAENGMWWTGKGQFDRQRSQAIVARTSIAKTEDRVTPKTPRINWAEVNEWYLMIASVGHLSRDRLQKLKLDLPASMDLFSEDVVSVEQLNIIEKEIAEACMHVQRTLLKASETILRRPGRTLRKPEDCRFLLILLANPLLQTNSGAVTYSNNASTAVPKVQPEALPYRHLFNSLHGTSASYGRSPSEKNSSNGLHSGILKRILGLLANLPSECHHHLVHWFSRLSDRHFRKLVDLVGCFVTYRLSRQHGRTRSDGNDPHGGLIPNISGIGTGSSAQLHATLGLSGAQRSPEKKDRRPPYEHDWQLKAAAKVMSLLFSANTLTPSRLFEAQKPVFSENEGLAVGPATRNHPRPTGRFLDTSAFYNTMLDHSDLVADFEAWESRKGNFSFCQYPMFLSIWAKIRIMEYDVRRQMEIKAREAFFNSILNRRAINQYLVLKIRRDCLVEDSLRSVSEIVGTGQDEIKKGLRIDFIGEEGLDSGGLRKEWFLLLVRDVFDPDHGLFVYDDESRYCYFNSNSFETSDQFFLVGVVLGLAIYNSTILDVALPPFAFRKLLASAPNYTGPSTATVRSTHNPTLEDLAEFRPSLARGFKKLLDYEGDVEETYCWDFVAVVERYGHTDHVPLCPNGEDRPVTNSNRHEFVELYVKHILDASVARQYQPFRRGFFSVCEGNALSLFRPEEIELLIRGSGEQLDVTALRAVAIYDGWGKGAKEADEPVLTWFWESFSMASAKEQRKLLSFITASDRIPAMGAMCLTIKISCLGDHSDRFPIARTCFNMLGLYRYHTRELLENKLWTAVNESEGFGMK